MHRILVALLALVFLGLGCREPQAASEVNPNATTPPPPQMTREVPAATFFDVKTGDRILVSGITIDVRVITSLTSQGCQGGPIGCPDAVELAITMPGREAQNITLTVLGGSTQTASSERTISGYRFVLSAITAETATIGVFLAPPSLISPGVQNF